MADELTPEATAGGPSGGLPPGADKWPQWKIDEWVDKKSKVGDSNQAKPIPNGWSANREKDLEITYNDEAAGVV